MFLRL